jgi:DNA-binding PadR family transcriptional regulator
VRPGPAAVHVLPGWLVARYISWMAFRMTEQAYLVLLSLAEKPRHGYGIVQTVLKLSDGARKLGAGTLYGLLDRMGAAGLVEASGEEVVGRLRRYYRLTDVGSAAAATETARLRALTRRARSALRASAALGGA